MILSAKIAYLKAFNEQQTVDFASDGNASASKLTLLVGPNNSGKSSLINILDGILHPRDNVFTASKEHRHGDNPPQVKVKCGPQEIALVEGTGSKYKVTGLSNEISSKVKFVPSRRPWTEAYSDPLDDAGYSSSYRHNRRANPGWLDSLFGGALGKLSTAPERKAAFNKLLTSVDPDIQDWRPENYAGQDFIEYQAKNGLWHRIGDVGMESAAFSEFVSNWCTFEAARLC